MANLPYPFSKAETPYHQLLLGTGEYVWIVLARDYDAVVDELERYKDLYASELLRGK